LAKTFGTVLNNDRMKKVAFGKVAKIDRTVAIDDECAILPYIGLEHIEKESGHFADGFVPIPFNMLATNFRFTPKHVLYGKLRPYLNKVVLPNFDGVCTTEILPILPNEGELDRVYLWAVLLSPAFVTWATSQISGANLPRLDPKLLAEYEIPLPPLPEQKRIASLLARADRLRQLRRVAHDLSDTLLQSVFLEMFEKVRRKAKEVLLGEISQIASGVTKGQNYNGRTTVEVPYLRVANVQDGYLDLSEIKTIQALPSEVEELRLQVGDVVMTEGGDFDKLGRGAIWRGELKNCIHQNHIFRVRFDKTKVLPEFFENYLLSREVKKYFLMASKQTTNLATINMTQLKQLPVPLYPLSLQEQFAGVVARVEALRVRMSEAERQAEGLFDSLLAKAFDVHA
jgi:type I restriction enzyme S subunit